MLELSFHPCPLVPNLRPSHFWNQTSLKSLKLTKYSAVRAQRDNSPRHKRKIGSERGTFVGRLRPGMLEQQHSIAVGPLYLAGIPF